MASRAGHERVKAILAQRCDFRPGDRIERYQVEKSLGEGAFGRVFKVKNEKGEIYALKLLKLWEVPPDIRQQLVDRFDMEFETGQIESPYLVSSIDHGFVMGNPYIVMEFCPNGDLLHWVGNTKKPDLAALGRDVLYGLKDLHRCGKVHRDLKPENVLIREEGRAVLTDFGIAGDRNKRMTERNLWGKPTQIFGTYAYMPPEQVHPDKDATVLPTTDIFSFGVMMYQLITRELPFGTLYDQNDLVNYIKNGREGRWDRSLLEDYPDGMTFNNVIEGCLIPDYRQRLASVDAVLELMPRGRDIAYKPTSHGEGMEIKNGVLLRIMQGEEYGKTYPLEKLLRDTRIITVGRKDSQTPNSLSITESQSCYISRKHCTLEIDAAGQWYIRDGQWEKDTDEGWKRSLNGTFINSSEVTPTGMAFYPGDIISIGDVKLRVEGY
ncbi:MAG: protein kinase [Odoribacteraceae bacterium]|jgi:serine/threonine protein kinase|nr:protein kinase [Odoribacteraceae bacterium]